MSRKRARPVLKAEETPEFVEFWEGVWLKIKHTNDGRGSARNEFFRHVEDYGSDPKDIVDGAKWFRANGGNSGEFKVHAQTWLNRQDYEDGCLMWRDHLAKQADMKARLAQAGPTQVKPTDNVVQLAPARPDEAARKAQVEQALDRLRGGA